MINESVALTVSNEGWGPADIIDLDRLDEAQNDRLQRLDKMIKSKHFGIVSPHRSFAHHDEQPLLKGMRKEGDPAIYQGDQTAAKLVGADFRGGGRQGLKAAHNAEAWRQLKTAVNHAGFRPLALVGAYPEKGGNMGTEASLIIPGQGNSGVRLTLPIMINFSRRYNQDGFIYSGPETGEKVHLFEVSARGKSGLPTAYDNHFDIGKAKIPSDIKSLAKRLHKPEGDPEKIQGLTQPVSHGEKDPGRPSYRTPLGKGKGTTFTP